MNRKPQSGKHEGTRIDVTTVRTQFATFAVAATSKGIAAIYPIRGSKVTAAGVARHPYLVRWTRAGAEMVVHASPRSYPASLKRATTALQAYASGKTRRL